MVGEDRSQFWEGHEHDSAPHPPILLLTGQLEACCGAGPRRACSSEQDRPPTSRCAAPVNLYQLRAFKWDCLLAPSVSGVCCRRGGACCPPLHHMCLPQLDCSLCTPLRILLTVLSVQLHSLSALRPTLPLPACPCRALPHRHCPSRVSLCCALPFHAPLHPSSYPLRPCTLLPALAALAHRPRRRSAAGVRGVRHPGRDAGAVPVCKDGPGHGAGAARHHRVSVRHLFASCARQRLMIALRGRKPPVISLAKALSPRLIRVLVLTGALVLPPLPLSECIESHQSEEGMKEYHTARGSRKHLVQPPTRVTHLPAST